MYMLAMTPQSVLYCFFALQWENKGEDTQKKEDEYSFSGPQTHLNPMMDANDARNYRS